MGLLQISLITLVACAVALQGTPADDCYGNDCGCIFHDQNEIDEKDLIFEPLRTQEAQLFLTRLASQLKTNWIAYVFQQSYSQPKESTTMEVGKPICKPEIKNVLGHWKDNGNTLCWIVGPDIYMAECCGEQCCGPNTRCEPSVYAPMKYLIYCDYYYNNGVMPTFAGVEEITVEEFETSSLGSGFGDRSNGTIGGYFAFRYDRFPLTCSCKSCVCC